MSHFTGRRSTGRAKTIGSALLAGLDALGTAMNDGPKRTRINEIDQLLIDLAQERDHLIVGLHEPGDLKPSENYDPSWSKPTAGVAESVSTEGRLVDCAGRSGYGIDRTSHPACPYRSDVHPAHDFKLRD